ncbi:hypothetical protein OG883_34420 [Streptomyces sp. NBC_01142]|uniref:hypothetical protein n=1 Tax=Streptomyces sp. NBC_01142 TaxID=2975865 RepID=UPI00224FBC18|nr:hypothetical protein [Streptomyces sp. NBC_01142]MCX4824862.1 hypothetical protein [Streptomyces sp. NBC_01142]
MIKSLIRQAGRLASAAFDIASNVLASDAPAEAIAAEQAGLYEADEMPAIEDIEAAAGQYSKAAELARAGDRGKRAAKKLLDRLPAGRYGAWLVSRVISNRQTADLDEIRATYKRLGLGPVPMKSAAPSLKVERLAAADEDETAAELVAA